MFTDAASLPFYSVCTLSVTGSRYSAVNQLYTAFDITDGKPEYHSLDANYVLRWVSWWWWDWQHGAWVLSPASDSIAGGYFYSFHANGSTPERATAWWENQVGSPNIVSSPALHVSCTGMASRLAGNVENASKLCG